MRRIVTGHNDNGKSVIKIDGPPARSIGEEIGGLFEIWNEDGATIDTKSSKDRADSDIILSINVLSLIALGIFPYLLFNLTSYLVEIFSVLSI